jgi:cytochrome P450
VEDDVIPLSAPLQTADGRMVDRISIAAGQTVSIPIRTMNRSTSMWGADAKEFKPQRWLEEGGIQERAKEIQGHRHLLTFVDGPRACLGKTFALVEFKVCHYLSSGLDADFGLA